MIKFISFDGSKFGSELVKNKFLSLWSITMFKDERMTKMDSAGRKILDMEYTFNSLFGSLVNMSAEHNRGFA